MTAGSTLYSRSEILDCPGEEKAAKRRAPLERGEAFPNHLLREPCARSTVALLRGASLLKEPGHPAGRVRAAALIQSGAYSKAVLRAVSLDPILVRKVKPAFLRDDYDTAIFQAFKEVEVRVRRKGGFSDSKIGVPLMREAFKPTTGPLTGKAAAAGEQQAMMDLFAGAIGTFKNPSSHRDVDYQPESVADIIGIANQLLRIVDEIS